MSKQELSISFRAEPNEARLHGVAEVLGRYGFDVISCYEDLGDQSPLYPLMILGRYTKTARIGPAGYVVPKYSTMEPLVGDIARLNSIRPDNVYLGLVPGAWMNSIGLKAASVAHMREAFAVSRYLLKKRDDGFEGDFYTVKPGFRVNYPTPENRVPFLVGAWKDNMAALAGEIADEIKVGGSANPLMVPIIKDRVAKGAMRIGRNPGEIGVVLGAVTVVDEDRNKALAIAKEKAAMYIAVIGKNDPTAIADFPEEVAIITQAMVINDTATAVAHLPADLARRFMLAGTPDDIIAQVEEIFSAGASRVEFGTPHGANQINGIKLLGEKVLPYFK